jgi:carbamoyl-phosphate synthase large subunit
MLQEGTDVVLLTSVTTELMMNRILNIPIYRSPLTAGFVRDVVDEELPDMVYAPFINSAGWKLVQQLAREGYWKNNEISVIGSGYNKSIKEVRQAIKTSGHKQVRAYGILNLTEAKKRLHLLEGESVVLRSDRGGISIIEKEDKFSSRVLMELQKNNDKQIYIEEFLTDWKGVEIGVLRDQEGSTKAVYSAENVTPVGKYTSESISVSPVRTLNASEKATIRNTASDIAEELTDFAGYCTVQFAINPETSEILVVNVKTGLPQSTSAVSLTLGSSLVSIITKLALGQTINELPLKISDKIFNTEQTMLLVPGIEPSASLKTANNCDTASMPIGKRLHAGSNFREVLHKAFRDGDHHLRYGQRMHQSFRNAEFYLLNSAMVQLANGESVTSVAANTNIDPSFLKDIQFIIESEKQLGEKKLTSVSEKKITSYLEAGGPDKSIELISEHSQRGGKHNVLNHCEHSERSTATISYFDCDQQSHISFDKKIVVLTTSGCRKESTLQIPAFVLVQEARRMGFKIVLATSNVESVSFWMTFADRLYIEKLSKETVEQIYKIEEPDGIFIEGGKQHKSGLETHLNNIGAPLIRVPFELEDEMVSKSGNFSHKNED